MKYAARNGVGAIIVVEILGYKANKSEPALTITTERTAS